MFTNIVIIPIFLYNSNTSGIAAIFVFLKICNIFRILVIIITVPYYYASPSIFHLGVIKVLPWYAFEKMRGRIRCARRGSEPRHAFIKTQLYSRFEFCLIRPLVLSASIRFITIVLSFVISAVSISVTSTLLTVILSYFFDRSTLKLEMLSFTVLRLFADAYLASASCYVIKLESLVS